VNLCENATEFYGDLKSSFLLKDFVAGVNTKVKGLNQSAIFLNKKSISRNTYFKHFADGFETFIFVVTSCLNIDMCKFHSSKKWKAEPSRLIPRKLM